VSLFDRLNLRDRLGLGTARLHRELTEARTERDTYRAQVNDLATRLDSLEEGLLSLGRDPDGELTGTQDPRLFRTLMGGSGGRDFDEAKRLEVLKMAHRTYALRGSAHNIAELYVDFIVGDGLEPKVKDDDDKDLAKLLDEIWADPRNNLKRDHEQMVRSLILEGERFGRANLSLQSGQLEIGYMPVEQVVGVDKDRLGRDVFARITELAPGGHDNLRFFVLDSLNEDIEIVPNLAASDPNAKYTIVERSTDPAGIVQSSSIQVEGLVFAWFINRPEGATRGRSELTEILDYIDIHDQLLWSEVERVKLLKTLVLDVKYNGLQPGQETQKLRELKLLSMPHRPRVQIHNEQVELQLLSAKVDGDQSIARLEETLALNIYGSKAFPEHWRGAGSRANLATAQAMEIVPMKRMRRKQRVVVDAFKRMVDIQIALRTRASSTKNIPEDYADRYEMNHSEVGGKDRKRGTEVLKDVVLAVTQAVTDNVMQPEAANTMIIQAAREAGFDLDSDVEGLPEQTNAMDQLELLRQRAAALGKDADDEPEPRIRGARDAA
jgi:hypothetical protein